ncbi:MAG: hypothetical protein JXR70_19395 [Spirochaetales bacterium]|nr:hypothetical protein [Spirochaetales bacterium]
MKTRNVFIIMMLVIAAMVSADTSMRLTLATANTFEQEPDFDTVWDVFYNKGKNPFWGIGWELIDDHIGFGGTYLADFFRDDVEQWNIDFYTEVFYVSFHFLGGTFIADPFVQVGLGSAGRVLLPCDKDYETYGIYHKDEALTHLVVFPYVTTGFALYFDGFVIGSKLNYNPTLSVPPATNFLEYPLGNFQAILYAGIAVDGSKHKKHNDVKWE